MVCPLTVIHCVLPNIVCLTSHAAWSQCIPHLPILPIVCHHQTPWIDPAKRPRNKLFFVCVGACSQHTKQLWIHDSEQNRSLGFSGLGVFCVPTLSERCSVDLLTICSLTYSFPWGPISIQCVFVLDPDFLPFLHGTNIIFGGGKWALHSFRPVQI